MVFSTFSLDAGGEIEGRAANVFALLLTIVAFQYAAADAGESYAIHTS